MKALTVQQPWAHAIVAGWKPIENRTTLWKHRGPLAIHAGTRLSDRGLSSPLIHAAAEEDNPDQPVVLDRFGRTWVHGPSLHRGAIIGTVNVVDVHVAQPDCCESPWAETQYVEHGGKLRRQLVHLVLEDARTIDPIPCLGRLGLWDLPADVLEQMRARA